MKNARAAIAIGVGAAITLACGSRPPDDRQYVERIAAERAEKDADFQKNVDPVPAVRKADLLPLAYFPIDPAYNVAATLKPDPAEDVVTVPTSTGAERQMRRAGTLEFVLKGQSLRLAVLVDVDRPSLDRLGVLFTDLTSGTETYGGGRYIDLDRNATGAYELDFNRAYNPYCYYNETYECPYPPRENRLQVPIRAGERLKHSNM